MNIFVGNLSSQTTEKQLADLFIPFGELKSVKVITDGYTGRPKGFAFIEMPEQGGAEKAIESLNNSTVNGQSMVVNEARPRTNNDGFNRKRY